VDTPAFGLIGNIEGHHYDVGWIERRLASPAMEAELKKLALADSVRFFGNLVTDSKGLQGFAHDAPLNTDDQLRVTFVAPRFVYQRTATSYGPLLKLLAFGIKDPQTALGLSADIGEFAGRLSRYWRARNIYLHGLIMDTEGRRAQAIDAFVESARLSEDFTAGYAQCLTLASLRAKANPAEARALLQRLVEAQPSRPVAREMLQRLGEE